ncbi:MAG: hypothetical protein ACREPE_06340, partial [Lysobacter sp.]
MQRLLRRWFARQSSATPSCRVPGPRSLVATDACSFAGEWREQHPPRTETRTDTRTNTRMHIETIGAGPALALIHGWAMH